MRPDNWRDRAYFARNDVRALAAMISHFEPVRLGAPADCVAELSAQVTREVTVVPLRYNDSWVRDTGPTVLVQEGGQCVAVDWRFNSWGGLFDEASEDDAVANQIADFEGMLHLQAPIVLEGGAIMGDGKGGLVVTEESVLSENRNPGLTRSEAERIFSQFLNVKAVTWLPRGLADDESGGHVDNVCAFADPKTLLLAATSDASHPSYERLVEARERLRHARRADGGDYQLIEVPLPEETQIVSHEAAGFDPPRGTIVRVAGTPLAPSHINFYVTNGAVFVPTFNGASDREALERIGSAFSNRQVVPFPSREFLLGGGAVHCLTKEIPR
jgi:agmatine deiminase